MKNRVPIFHAWVSPDIKLELAEAERELRKAYLRGLVGKNVEVIVRKVRTQRSLDMNAYLHAVVFPILAEYFGESIEDTKLVTMGECWGWKTDKVTGRDIPINAHTSDMSVEESAYFVDWVVPWALTKFGVVIPLPNESAAA